MHGDAECKLLGALAPGHVIRLEVGGEAVLSRGKVPERLIQLTRRYEPPATWAPPAGAVNLEDIEQAEGRVQRERQAQRETAACGCTEGGGAGEGVGDGKGGGTSTPETFIVPLKVIIRGVPKAVLK